MLTFPKGTKEYIRVPVRDVTGQLTDLAAAGLRYDIVRDSDDVKLVDNAVGTNQGMTGLCMLDTTLVPNNWIPDKYKLYTRFTNLAPEVPVLGPLEFLITDD